MRTKGTYRLMATAAASSMLVAACACHLATHPRPAASSDRAKVRVTWTVESSQNLYGFNILRGHSPDGPWTRVNATPILAAEGPTTNIPHDYEFIDQGEDLLLGQEYWYWLESVDNDGTRRRVWWPPAKVVPKTGIDEDFPPPKKP